MARRPNILITGTPGTGKTTTCQQLAASTGFEHVDVGKLVRCAHKCPTTLSARELRVPCAAAPEWRLKTSRWLLPRDKELHTGWDEEFECHTLDEDKACAAGNQRPAIAEELEAAAG